MLYLFKNCIFQPTQALSSPQGSQPHLLHAEPQLLAVIHGIFVRRRDHPNVNIHG
jgi:hypothetical protein